MTTQHHISFTRVVLSSTQRLFRSNEKQSLLAANYIDAHTARDIGINAFRLN